MTRKDYVRAAAIVRDRLEHAWNYDTDTTREQCVLIAGSFVELFAPDNPRFDANRFLMACGLQEKPAKTRKTRTTATSKGPDA